MPHVLVNEPPGSSLIRASPVRNAFGGQVIGSTARLRRRTSGSVSPREEHQIGVALVDPERDPSSVVRISELDTSEAILVPFEVGECVVERRRADLPRLPEIVFRVLHGFRADRKAALVGPQDSSPGHAQHQTIDRLRSRRSGTDERRSRRDTALCRRSWPLSAPEVRGPTTHIRC